MAAHRLAPREPLPLLCLAVAQLTQALSKKVPNRDRAVLTAFAFLQVQLHARALCLHMLCSQGCQAPKVILDRNGAVLTTVAFLQAQRRAPANCVRLRADVVLQWSQRQRCCERLISREADKTPVYYCNTWPVVVFALSYRCSLYAINTSWTYQPETVPHTLLPARLARCKQCCCSNQGWDFACSNIP